MILLFENRKDLLNGSIGCNMVRFHAMHGAFESDRLLIFFSVDVLTNVVFGIAIVIL